MKGIDISVELAADKVAPTRCWKVSKGASGIICLTVDVSNGLSYSPDRIAKAIEYE